MSGCGPINTDGVLFPESYTRFSEITDGTSQTFMVGERWYQLRVWAQGVYYSAPAQSTKHPLPGACVSSAKNIDWNYTPNASLKDPLVTYYASHSSTDRPDSGAGQPKKMMYNDMIFGSFHSGGANFALADASVHFINDSIDGLLYASMASKDGGEVADGEY